MHFWEVKREYWWSAHLTTDQEVAGSATYFQIWNSEWINSGTGFTQSREDNSVAILLRTDIGFDQKFVIK